MKTWQRREWVETIAGGRMVRVNPPVSYPGDGVLVAEEVSQRLADGWELLAADTGTFNLRSPAVTGALTRTWVNYFIEGFD